MNEHEIRKLKSDIETTRTLLEGVAAAVDRLADELEERKQNEVRLLQQTSPPNVREAVPADELEKAADSSNKPVDMDDINEKITGKETRRRARGDS